MTENQTIGAAYIQDCILRLEKMKSRIKHCLDQLDDQQLWWRPQEAMNSPANILLHLAGNLRQWIINGVRRQPDTRTRPQEFADRSNAPKEEIWRQFEQTVAETRQVLENVTDEELLESRKIQGFEETVLSAIADSLSHLAGHTQEIIYITRLQLGNKYQFAWVPKTKAEGAPE